MIKMIINITKKVHLLLLFIFFFSNLNAQDIMCIQEQEGTINQLKIYNIDSISFNQNPQDVNPKRSIMIHENGGSVLNYNIAQIDSLTFTKRNIKNKQGFVIIRVDDDYPSKEIVTMANVLDKYGFKLTNCFNPSIANDDMIDAVKALQKNGHEITDHTPNHTTAFADMKTKAQINKFVGLPGVERIDGLRVYFNWAYPTLSSCIVPNDSIETTAGSSIIKILSKINPLWTQQIYTTEFGWILLSNFANNQAIALQAKSREKVVFTKSSKEQLYIVDSYSVNPTIDGMKAMMLASQTMFEYLDIQYSKYWVMCGGPWAMAMGDIICAAGTPMGYFGGSEISTDGNIQITYNQNNPLSRWSSNILSIQSDITPAASLKRTIANEVAKHLGVIDLVHMWYKNSQYCTIFTGTNEEKFKQYLENLEEMLRFCYDNDIPVVTYKEAINLTINSKTDPTTNVLPPLYRDLTSQGFPDGYSLDSKTAWINSFGVPEDKGYSFTRVGNGNIFWISKIGGFEKGENTFSFYAKGQSGSSLVIAIGNSIKAITYQVVKIPILNASNQFVKFETKINFPENVDFFNFGVSVVGNEDHDFYISGMYIGKK